MKSIIKFREIASVLKKRIENDVYHPGQLIPPEPKLMEEFSVSRITIRQAIGILTEEGYLKKERGRGTTVLQERPAENQRKGLNYGFAVKSDCLNLFQAFTSMADGISEGIWQKNIQLSIFPFSGKIDQVAMMRSIVESNIVDAFLLFSMGGYEKEIVSCFEKMHMPFIYVEHNIHPFRKNYLYQASFDLSTPILNLYSEIRKSIRRIKVIGFSSIVARNTFDFFFSLDTENDFHVTQLKFEAADVAVRLQEYITQCRKDPSILTVIGDSSMLCCFSAVCDLMGVAKGEIPVLYVDNQLVQEELKERFSMIHNDFVEFGRRISMMLEPVYEQRLNPEKKPVRLRMESEYVSRGTVNGKL